MPDKKKDAPLLEVKDLTVITDHLSKESIILNQISFEIPIGKTLALVGESGSGKTITAFALLDILPENLKKVSGEILFKGNPINGSGKNSFTELRGKNISIIFQEPVSALNPVFEIGDQLSSIIRTHQVLSKKEAGLKALESLSEVGLPYPEKIYHSYPYQLSGGMAQRVMIAMALSCRPQLVIADEPTTALDVTTQLKILNLLRELQQLYKYSLLIISHDMRIISSLADSVLILHEGKVAYQGKFNQHLRSSKNSYIRSFFEMMPTPAES
jgi:ABC-type glutathione transport system ATPase component